MYDGMGSSRRYCGSGDADKRFRESGGMNEYFAANGLNSGTSGQSQLAQNNTYQKNIGSLETAKANALSEVETERTKLSTQYQNAIAQAIADNNYKKAQALYEEAVRVDNSLVDTALNRAQLNYQQQNTDYERSSDMADNLAQYGIFSGYKALGYSDAQIAAMQSAYNAAVAAKSGGSSGGGGSSNSWADDSSSSGSSTIPAGLTSGMAKNLWILTQTPSRKTETLSDGSALIPTRIAQALKANKITEAEAWTLNDLYKKM